MNITSLNGFTQKYVNSTNSSVSRKVLKNIVATLDRTAPAMDGYESLKITAALAEAKATLAKLDNEAALGTFTKLVVKR